ncbi:hypothetical protein RI367_003217 [Sorochytrium milnesiophthora]
MTADDVADYLLSPLLIGIEPYSPVPSPALSVALSDISSAWDQPDAMYLNTQHQHQHQQYAHYAHSQAIVASLSPAYSRAPATGLQQQQHMQAQPSPLSAAVSPYTLWIQPPPQSPLEQAVPATSFHSLVSPLSPHFDSVSFAATTTTTQQPTATAQQQQQAAIADSNNSGSPPTDSSDQRLPAYEVLIAQALAALQNPDGVAPRVIFDWMQENYPDLPRGFRGSATQALKKALHKRRVLRTKRSGYIVNPAYESKPVYGRVKKGGLVTLSMVASEQAQSLDISSPSVMATQVGASSSSSSAASRTRDASKSRRRAQKPRATPRLSPYSLPTPAVHPAPCSGSDRCLAMASQPSPLLQTQHTYMPAPAAWNSNSSPRTAVFDLSWDSINSLGLVDTATSGATAAAHIAALGGASTALPTPPISKDLQPAATPSHAPTLALNGMTLTDSSSLCVSSLCCSAAPLAYDLDACSPVISDVASPLPAAPLSGELPVTQVLTDFDLASADLYQMMAPSLHTPTLSMFDMSAQSLEALSPASSAVSPCMPCYSPAAATASSLLDQQAMQAFHLHHLQPQPEPQRPHTYLSTALLPPAARQTASASASPSLSASGPAAPSFGDMTLYHALSMPATPTFHHSPSSSPVAYATYTARPHEQLFQPASNPLDAGYSQRAVAFDDAIRRF